MEMSPERVRSMSFSTVKKGFDSGELTAFIQEVATALEAAQKETATMEASARAAVARLQELSQASEQPASAGAIDVDARDSDDDDADIDDTTHDADGEVAAATGAPPTETRS